MASVHWAHPLQHRNVLPDTQSHHAKLAQVFILQTLRQEPTSYKAWGCALLRSRGKSENDSIQHGQTCLMQLALTSHHP
eukprot:5246556-Amphidinium_carterae.1